jgi:two-component system, NtrC family, response regulator
LLESEMFGFKKGSFTGAISDKKGLVEEANEGTLFLDEIGDMSPDLQSKLLRVLEYQSFIKIGDTKQTFVNIRIIAATNKDLLKESEKGNFRSDLYYRLAAFKISIPPLRERIEDIEPLTAYFLSIFSLKMKKKVTGFDKNFIEKLKNYNWRGNVRELRNVIEMCVILTEKEILTIDLLPYEILNFGHFEDPESEINSLEGVEKKQIRKILALTHGNKTRTAEMLGIGVTTLYRKLEQYKIE